MSDLVPVSVLLTGLVAVTAWSVKTRSRWAGNGVLVWCSGLVLWGWLLVAATGIEAQGMMWVTFGLSHLLVALTGLLTGWWMGDALPGADGRGWFHLSTVVAAAELLSLRAGFLALVLQSAWHLGEGGDDLRFALLLIGGTALVLWISTVVSMVRFILDIRHGRWRHTPRRADAVIVLGAGLVGNRVSELLACRCDRAADAWCSVTGHRPADSAPLIVSGGQGDDELCTEAEAMHRYLAGKGFPRGAVLEERQATDTTENLHFSLDLLAGRGVSEPSVVVCTSDFHVLRTEKIIAALQEERGARGRPFTAVVLGAPTPKPVLPASYLREYVALTLYRIIGRA